MEFKLHEDGKFKYIDEGEGQPIVVLHGLFGALSNFSEVLKHFSKDYRVIIPVLPIYDLPIIKTSIKNLAVHLGEFIDHMKLEETIILGNSLGGHVGLVYSHEHPEKVNKLILTGSSGLYENAFGGGFPKRESKDFLRKRIEITFYDQSMVTDELVDECHEAVNNREKVIRIISLAKSAIRHNMAKELPQYKMPVCLIWGMQDNITPPHVAEEFQDQIPDAELFWIDKCGHAAMMEQPSTFNNILDAWLTKRAD
jgi:pimeloyl-ACP methyl ester carboxylesterase